MNGRARAMAGAVLLLAGGCAKGESSPAAPASESAAPAASAGSPCGADARRLPGSGQCVSAMEARMPRPEKIWDDGNDCKWTVTETALPADEWLVYRALSCKAGTARLEYGGGARQAEFTLVSSAFGALPAGAQRWSILRMIPAEHDTKPAILAFARSAIDDPAEAADCRVRLAGISGWPGDALVVDVSETRAAREPEDEPRTACGRYGLDEDTSAFWRPVGAYALYFDLGQDTPEVDAGSFLVVGKAN